MLILITLSRSLRKWLTALTNIPFTEDRLLNACGADRLPSASEAEVLARAYAAFLSNPRR